LISIRSLCAPVAICFCGIQPVVIDGVRIAPGIIIISLLPLIIGIISLVNITAAVGIYIVGSATSHIAYTRVCTRPGIIACTSTWLSVTCRGLGITGIRVSGPVILNTRPDSGVSSLSLFI
jgi:hypothetical protein